MNTNMDIIIHWLFQWFNCSKEILSERRFFKYGEDSIDNDNIVILITN